jgi:predicted ATPase
VITRIALDNFKAFRRLDIPIRPLTLLAGTNGSGKSSLLQSLGVLRQSFETGCLSNREGLLLNGEFVELGTGKDVLFEYAEEQVIGISVSDGTEEAAWTFEYSEKDDLLSLVGNQDRCDHAPFFSRRMQFLRADRIVPAAVYPRSYAAAVRRRFLGVHGQFAPHFLAVHQDEPVRPGRSSSAAPSARLLDQVNAWLAEISPGASVSAKEIGGTDLAQLSFVFGGRAGLRSSNEYRPANVGFGLTYSLPIIVACLAADVGDVVLVENPEAHLHPRGQTMMGRLASICAQDGVQLLIESHSEHVLNGIRLSVRGNAISKDRVALHFFMPGEESRGSTCASPTIDSSGRLDQWPEGFFDEWERALLGLV